MENNNMCPFVKWAGGKRQLLDKIKEKLPQQYNRYFEPFVGGGAVLFGLQPKDCLINDINESLVNVYNVIKKNPDKFIDCIQQYDENIVNGNKEYYYLVRDRYNKKLLNKVMDIDTAALFVFLNKHCFNGLYRVNKKGLFNVPFNNSVKSSFDKANIYSISNFLQNIEIKCGDFEVACLDAKKGDFVFLIVRMHL